LLRAKAVWGDMGGFGDGKEKDTLQEKKMS
jgi:hypothetical protein